MNVGHTHACARRDASSSVDGLGAMREVHRISGLSCTSFYSTYVRRDKVLPQQLRSIVLLSVHSISQVALRISSLGFKPFLQGTVDREFPKIPGSPSRTTRRRKSRETFSMVTEALGAQRRVLEISYFVTSCFSVTSFVVQNALIKHF